MVSVAKEFVICVETSVSALENIFASSGTATATAAFPYPQDMPLPSPLEISDAIADLFPDFDLIIESDEWEEGPMFLITLHRHEKI